MSFALPAALAFLVFASSASTLSAQSDAEALPLSDPRAFVGRWVGTGYTCRGAEPEEIVEISFWVWSGLEARKIIGDECITASELTWRNGKLTGQTIQAEFHVRELGGSFWDDRWLAGPLQVVSRHEITGFGVTFRRQDREEPASAAPPAAAIDLSGVWTTRDVPKWTATHPGRIRITQQGTEIVATWVEAPPIRNLPDGQWGDDRFFAGREAFRGRIKGRRVVGTGTFHLLPTMSKQPMCEQGQFDFAGGLALEIKEGDALLEGSVQSDETYVVHADQKGKPTGKCQQKKVGLENGLNVRYSLVREPGAVAREEAVADDPPACTPANAETPPTLRFLIASEVGPAVTYSPAASVQQGESPVLEARFSEPLCSSVKVLMAHVELGRAPHEQGELALDAVESQPGVYRSRRDGLGMLITSVLDHAPENVNRITANLPEYRATRSVPFITEFSAIEIAALDRAGRATAARSIRVGERYRVALTFQNVKSAAAKAPQHFVILEDDSEATTSASRRYELRRAGQPGRFESVFTASQVGRIIASYYAASAPVAGTNMITVYPADLRIDVFVPGVVDLPPTNRTGEREIGPGEEFGFRIDPGSRTSDHVELVVTVVRDGEPGAKSRIPAKLLKGSPLSRYETELIYVGERSLIGDLRPGDRVRAGAPGINAISDWVRIKPIAGDVRTLALDVLDAEARPTAETVELGGTVQARLEYYPSAPRANTAYATLEVVRNGSAVSKQQLPLRRGPFPSYESFVSDRLPLDGTGALEKVRAGDTIRAVYDEDHVAELQVTAPPVLVTLASVSPEGAASGQYLTRQGLMRVAVTFQRRPPRDRGAKVQLRTLRRNATLLELEVPVTVSKDDSRRYESEWTPVFRDHRFGELAPGDRIEARYDDSGPWAPTPAAAVTVVGREGAVRAIRFVSDGPQHEEVAELRRGSSYGIEVELESPVDEHILSIDIESGPPPSDRVFAPGDRSGDMVRSSVEKAYRDNVDPAKYRAGAVSVNAHPGHIVSARCKNAVKTATVKGPEAIPPRHGRVEVVGRDAFGGAAAWRVTFYEEKYFQRRHDGATNAPIDLPEGVYRVSLNPPGANYQTLVRVQAGGQVKVTPAGALGVVSFDLRDAKNIPVTATVAITQDAPPRRPGQEGWEAQFTGEVPSGSLTLPVGTYKVRLSGPSFPSEERQITVAAGATTTVTINPR